MEITNLDYLKTLKALAESGIKITFLRYMEDKSKLLIQVKSPVDQIKAKSVLKDMYKRIELSGINTLVLYK